MKKEFDIQTLYSRAFGYFGMPFFGIKSKTMQDEGYVAHPGSKYFMPVEIDGKMLPNEPLVSFQVKKHIVETPLAGNTRRGTVKELINTADYEVTIQGFCVNSEGRSYPYSQVENLKNLFEKNKTVSVKCDLTRLLEIDYVVIKELKIPATPGVQNIQAYEIKCVSDTYFTLIKD